MIVFVGFPFISYGRSFLTEEHKWDYFFFDHLACSNHALKLFCVHIPNAIKVTKFGTIPMKLWFKKKSKQKHFSAKSDRRAPEG